MQYTCNAEGCCTEEVYDIMEHRLMQMAMMAHREVLFDKIKERIEKQEGEKLEKIAELLVESSRNSINSQINRHEKKKELSDRIRDIFSE